MTARAVALVKSLFMLSMTSKPLPSRLHLLIVPLAELIQYIFPAGKSIESPEEKTRNQLETVVWNAGMEYHYDHYFKIYLTCPIYLSECEMFFYSLKYSCDLFVAL